MAQNSQNTTLICFYIFNKCSYKNDSTRFRIAKLQRFQIYINDLRLIKIIDEILILSLFSNHDTFFCNFCQVPEPSTACVTNLKYLTWNHLPQLTRLRYMHQTWTVKTQHAASALITCVYYRPWNKSVDVISVMHDRWITKFTGHSGIFAPHLSRDSWL
jgi:hypothetical protein